MLSGILLVCGYLLLIAGCESGSDTSQDSSIPRTQPGYEATVPQDPVRPPEMRRPGSGEDAVADTALEIEISGSGVTITANEISAQEILYTLAARSGFEVVESGVPWDTVTLTIKTENLHAALVELLKQYPYQIIYEFDHDIQADALKRVVVGDQTAGQERIQSAAAGSSAVTTGRQDHEITPSVSYATTSAAEQVYLTQLLDPSPEVREEAAEDVEPEGVALDYLAMMVTTDPSPEVRMAAALTLGDSDDPKALDALVMALQDEDPRVLEEVIDALAYTGNRSTIPYLQPFLNHPDEDVRDAAESAIDDLE
jgi:HEAT repeat protein